MATDPTGRISHIQDMHRGLTWKPACRVATTANITISTALNSGDTLDGVTLATGDRVLVKNQSTPSQNGIYIVGATPTRAADMDQDTTTTTIPAEEIAGAVVFVISGTVNTKTIWYTTNAVGGTVGSTSIVWAQFTGSGSTSSGLHWFNVTDSAYGAVNDGTTNDRAAINLAIAALNAAGKGVLYFPAGTGYATTGGGLTAITANCLILGDGASEDGSLSGTGADSVSQIITDNATVNFMDITGPRALVRGLLLRNTAATPSAGCGIRVLGSSYSRVNFEDVVVRGFYVNIDSQTNANWYMTGCMLYAPVLYALKIRNTVNADAGDWTLMGSVFAAAVRTATSAIRVESSGGGKIIGCKINTGGSTFTTGVDVSIGSGNDTSILELEATSIENVTGDAIAVETTGTGRFGLISVIGIQVGLYSNNTGRAVKITAASTGAYPAAGTIGITSIDGGTFFTDGTARAAVSLTNCDNVVLGDYAIGGFNARYTSSGATNITDGGAASALTIKDEGGALATAATSLDFVGSGVTASGTGAAKTITIPAATAADVSALGFVGAILISDTPSTPLVFADLIQNEAQDDLVYADV